MCQREVAAHLGKLSSFSDLLIYSALQLQASNWAWQETLFPVLWLLSLSKMGTY